MKTKKTKIANYLKLGFLLFGISILLWNCEKDNEFENSPNENQITKQQLTIQRLSSKSINNNKELETIISDFGIKNLINTNNKSHVHEKSNHESSKFDFTIDTKLIKKVKTDSVISYTMLINRNNKKQKKGLFENLVIEKRGDSLKGYFISYNLNKKFLLNSQKENLSGTAKKTTYAGNINELVDNINKLKNNSLLSKMQEDCGTTEIFVEVSCPCAGHWPGTSCQCQTQPETIRYVFDNSCNEEGFEDGQTYYSDGTNTGGGGTSSSYSATVIPTEDLRTFKKDFINSLEISQRDFFLNNNYIQDYLAANNYSESSKQLVIASINILITPILSNNNSISNYTTDIQRMTTHLKQFGNPEDEFFADYIDNLIPDFNSMTVGDVYDIYTLTRNQVHNLTKKYLEAVVVPFAEAAYPFVIYALTEATLGAALPLLSRIPLSMVTQGSRLNKIVKQVGLLGVQGTSNSIRIVTTNGNAYSKSLELFTSLTKNAQSITVHTNGTRVALFNNGNKIVFRTQSSSGFPATLELTFSEIWTNTRIIKFQ